MTGTPEVFLSYYVYTREAIDQTTAAFSAYVDTRFCSTEDGTLISFSPKPDAPLEVIPEFLNYALNLSVEHSLGEAT